MTVLALISSFVLATAGPDLFVRQQVQDQATSLPDVEITGVPTPERVRDFVGRIAAPPRGRGLARWQGKLCPGVVNLDREAAEPILDRIGDAARSVGVEVGEPGCNPNLVIVFAVDGAETATAMVEKDRRLFDVGVGGIARDSAALREFQTSDAPVRSWSLSFPVDAETGTRAVRVPGDAPSILSPDLLAAIGCSSDCPLAYAPAINSTSASRLQSRIEDALYKTIVIVDVDRMGDVNTTQIGDYLAFVGLAQIDGAADTLAFDTVLNLFSGGADGMTDWDRSYLRALYGSRSGLRSADRQAGEVSNIMIRDRRTEAQRQ